MNVIPLDEPSEPRCSNLSVPLFGFENIEHCLRKHLAYLSRKQWTALATDDITSDVVNLLTKMCRVLIEHISSLVFKVVRPQVLCCPHNHDRGDNESSADRMNAEPLLDGCSYCRVTEDDIQASLRNIFDNCFGWVLGFGQRRSCDSDKLLTLFSVSIAKNVNSALSRITGSTSLQSDSQLCNREVLAQCENVLMISVHLILMKFQLKGFDCLERQQIVDQGF
ncbi:uncharacterized protein LOC106098608 isoform X3 [Oreochromis niloticus]|uniref:uncharacterized protein LOC106098608 isoform X3 n=1 Tax=Oreochromis niloticus TaxID=8128 RepID=UPI00090516E6|nr:uncharacterized protein LOC106098608 isoform X3 [Oreochromis niloticus]